MDRSTEQRTEYKQHFLYVCLSRVIRKVVDGFGEIIRVNNLTNFGQIDYNNFDLLFVEDEIRRTVHRIT